MQVFIRTLGKNRIEREEIDEVSGTRVGVVLVLEDGQEFTVRDGTSGLRISADGRLVVEPEASNVIQVSELRE